MANSSVDLWPLLDLVCVVVCIIMVLDFYGRLIKTRRLTHLSFSRSVSELLDISSNYCIDMATQLGASNSNECDRASLNLVRLIFNSARVTSSGSCALRRLTVLAIWNGLIPVMWSNPMGVLNYVVGCCWPGLLLAKLAATTGLLSLSAVFFVCARSAFLEVSSNILFLHMNDTLTYLRVDEALRRGNRYYLIAQVLTKLAVLHAIWVFGPVPLMVTTWLMIPSIMY